MANNSIVSMKDSGLTTGRNLVAITYDWLSFEMYDTLLNIHTFHIVIQPIYSLSCHITIFIAFGKS